MFPRATRAASFAGILALSFSVFVGPVGAQTNAQRIDELESAIHEAGAAEAAQLTAYRSAQAARASADAKVKALDAQAMKAAEEQVAADAELAQTSGRNL